MLRGLECLFYDDKVQDFLQKAYDLVCCLPMDNEDRSTWIETIEEQSRRRMSFLPVQEAKLMNALRESVADLNKFDGMGSVVSELKGLISSYGALKGDSVEQYFIHENNNVVIVPVSFIEEFKEKYQTTLNDIRVLTAREFYDINNLRKASGYKMRQIADSRSDAIERRPLLVGWPNSHYQYLHYNEHVWLWMLTEGVVIGPKNSAGRIKPRMWINPGMQWQRDQNANLMQSLKGNQDNIKFMGDAALVDHNELHLTESSIDESRLDLKNKVYYTDSFGYINSHPAHCSYLWDESTMRLRPLYAHQGKIDCSLNLILLDVVGGKDSHEFSIWRQAARDSLLLSDINLPDKFQKKLLSIVYEGAIRFRDEELNRRLYRILRQNAKNSSFAETFSDAQSALAWCATEHGARVAQGKYTVSGLSLHLRDKGLSEGLGGVKGRILKVQKIEVR